PSDLGGHDAARAALRRVERVDLDRAVAPARVGARVPDRRTPGAATLRHRRAGAGAHRDRRGDRLARLGGAGVARRMGRAARRRRDRPRHRRARAVAFAGARADRAVGTSRRTARARRRIPASHRDRAVLRGRVRQLIAVAAGLVVLLTGCTSPESTRQRAGGPGADVGNSGSIELHGGADPYYRTPSVVRAPRSTALAASPGSTTR